MQHYKFQFTWCCLKLSTCWFKKIMMLGVQNTIYRGKHSDLTLSSLQRAIQTSDHALNVKPLHCVDHQSIRIGNERERLVAASPVMAKSRVPAGGHNYPENGLVKPPGRDTRALSPVDVFGGKEPLRLAAEKSRPREPSVPMRSAPAYFLCKWGYKLD